MTYKLNLSHIGTINLASALRAFVKFVAQYLSITCYSDAFNNSSKELLKVLDGKKKEKEINEVNSETPDENQLQSLRSFHYVPVAPDCLDKEQEQDSNLASEWEAPLSISTRR
jgi:hypothetical protein